MIFLQLACRRRTYGHLYFSSSLHCEQDCNRGMRRGDACTAFRARSCLVTLRLSLVLSPRACKIEARDAHADMASPVDLSISRLSLGIVSTYNDRCSAIQLHQTRSFSSQVVMTPLYISNSTHEDVTGTIVLSAVRQQLVGEIPGRRILCCEAAFCCVPKTRLGS